jgi:hypothetical protein
MANAPKTVTTRRSKAMDSSSPRAQRAARRQKTSVKTLDTTAAPTPKPTKATGPVGKLGAIVELMRRPEGATVAQMSEATNWLPHSVRGALAGALKKKHKLLIKSDASEGGRIYRVGASA